MNDERVALFIPCLVDQVYPEMGMDMVRVLEHLGHEVSYDGRQTCCGQPAFNAGHREESLAVATTFMDVFDGSDTIVCPSGSCTAMVRNFFSVLFCDDERRERARALGGRVRELSEFLVSHGDVDRISGTFRGRIGFHNSCHAVRELGLHREPLSLLERISGCEIVTAGPEPVCCGFGGLFSVKFDAVAAAMAQSRIDVFVESGVDELVSNDPGCILHMRQECQARGIDLRIRHLVEFLAEAMAL